MLNVLVTGANGFVGRHLACVAQCDPRVSIFKGLKNQDQILHKNDRALGDFSRGFIDPKSLSGIDVLIHLAARVHVMNEQSSDPIAEFRKVNVEGTKALLVAARQARVKRFIYVSSIKVNGEKTSRDIPFDENSKTLPSDAYAISKFEAEELVKEFCVSESIEWVIVRPPLVYGGGVGGNFEKLIFALSKNIPLPVLGLNNKRSLVSVENLSSFLIECAVNPLAANEVFLVSDGRNLSVAELVFQLNLLFPSKSFLFYVNRGFLFNVVRLLGRGSVAQRMCGELVVDISKANKVLEWQPPYSIEECLIKMKSSK